MQFHLGYTNNYVIFPLICIGFITGLFVNGYMFKIIKTSLNEENKLPGFNAWINMLIDGIKVFLVSIVYLVVPTLIIMLLIPLLFSGFDLSILGMAYTSLESTGINPASVSSFRNLARNRKYYSNSIKFIPGIVHNFYLYFAFDYSNLFSCNCTYGIL